MSVQFGRCYFDTRRVDGRELDKLRLILRPYGPDAEGILCQDGAVILYRALHTTKESRKDVQPVIANCGVIVTWNGRLDNREELLHQLDHGLNADSPDSALVVAAYERWGIASFAKLNGDWALAIWDKNNRTLLLAKDFVGTQHLYYSLEKDHAAWSTLLDPLVLFSRRGFRLNEEYIAGWLAHFPAVEITPYAGIYSVPPACFVRLAQGQRRVTKYWDFDPAKTIRYRADEEYQDHFCDVFAEAVRRRLRSPYPVLAELSGGMDSSAIVCVADSLFSRGAAGAPRLDTLSYYNDAEPDWDERPYFTQVESKRGRTGCHIDVGDQATLPLEFADDRFAATPSAGCLASNSKRAFEACLAGNGNRVLLSGIGGDEVMGGVPTPVPELQDRITDRRWRELAHSLKLWALAKRTPWLHLLLEAVRGFAPDTVASRGKERRPARWLQPGFIRRNRAALHGYRNRITLSGPAPSFQANRDALQMLRRQLGCTPLSCTPVHELRYPYLDRDLLEFLFALPRQQLVRPQQRRSLMRRALVNLVPKEILERRKGFVSRTPLTMISLAWPQLAAMCRQMKLADLGVVEPNILQQELQRARGGQEVATVLLLRVLTVEAWLRHVSVRGILFGSQEPQGVVFENELPTTISAENNYHQKETQP